MRDIMKYKNALKINLVIVLLLSMNASSYASLRQEQADWAFQEAIKQAKAQLETTYPVSTLASVPFRTDFSWIKTEAGLYLWSDT